MLCGRCWILPEGSAARKTPAAWSLPARAAGLVFFKAPAGPKRVSQVPASRMAEGFAAPCEGSSSKWDEGRLLPCPSRAPCERGLQYCPFPSFYGIIWAEGWVSPSQLRRSRGLLRGGGRGVRSASADQAVHPRCLPTLTRTNAPVADVAPSLVQVIYGFAGSTV